MDELWSIVPSSQDHSDDMSKARRTAQCLQHEAVNRYDDFLSPHNYSVFCLASHFLLCTTLRAHRGVHVKSHTLAPWYPGIENIATLEEHGTLMAAADYMLLDCFIVAVTRPSSLVFQ